MEGVRKAGGPDHSYPKVSDRKEQRGKQTLAWDRHPTPSVEEKGSG